MQPGPAWIFYSAWALLAASLIIGLAMVVYAGIKTRRLVRAGAVMLALIAAACVTATLWAASAQVTRTGRQLECMFDAVSMSFATAEPAQRDELCVDTSRWRVGEGGAVWVLALVGSFAVMRPRNQEAKSDEVPVSTGSATR